MIYSKNEMSFHIIPPRRWWLYVYKKDRMVMLWRLKYFCPRCQILRRRVSSLLRRLTYLLVLRPKKSVLRVTETFSQVQCGCVKRLKKKTNCKCPKPIEIRLFQRKQIAHVVTYQPSQEKKDSLRGLEGWVNITAQQQRKRYVDWVKVEELAIFF